MRDRQKKTSASISLEESESVALDKTATKPEALVGINAKKQEENNAITPLFYAVMSGRPETVALLLDAGADVKMGNIFQACLEFEEEVRLQSQSKSPRRISEMDRVVQWKFSDLYLDTRSSLSYRETLDLRLDDTARLEEIVDMLVNSGADLSLIQSSQNYEKSIMETAITKNQDYTVACLMHALRKGSSSLETDKGDEDLTKMYETMRHFRQEASIQAWKSLKSLIAKNDGQCQTVPSRVLTWCLTLREYHLIEELSKSGISFLPTSTDDENCNLYHLISLGLATLFESIASREAELMLNKGDRPANGDDAAPRLTPLIVAAIQRELPNMDILRLLVEKFKVDIAEKDASGDCALFHVVRGNRWWHVHQALPYLLDTGVDINMRNEKGQTLLHMALQGDGKSKTPGPYNWDAARLLVRRGADVNAVDNEGRSCLACAQQNADMTRFLIEHDAIVAEDSIFAAIDSRKAEVLRALLSGGLDPNTRRDKPLLETYERPQNELIEPQEEFPLYHAASMLLPHYQPTLMSYQDASETMETIQVLLDHGADPFAKFLKRIRKTKRNSDFLAAANSSIPVPKGYMECTLLHEVLWNGCIVDTFLQIPNLDVHHQDAKGRTLLHMLCENNKGPDYVIGSYVQTSNRKVEERVHSFQRLLSLGSDLRAQDNFGHNVLHYILTGEQIIEPSRYVKFLAYTLQNAPELANQGNCNGETPLHHAMIRAIDRNDYSEAEMLLEAGADPLIVSKRGDTMLHILGKGIDIAVLRTFFESLVGRGIDINARNALGETALFSFYDRPKTDSDTWLLEEVDRPTGKHVKPMLEKLGGDFFVKDNKGRGLLHAAARGDVERFQELLGMGLDPMLEDDAQQTAIDVAAACGNRDILELFEKKK
jgi:ankyrin repeat protein